MNIQWVSLTLCSRSRFEGDKRTERAEIQHGPCQCRKKPDGGDHGSGLEVSGSAVSVSRGKSPGEGAANRGTYFSRPHRQAPVGRYMNCQVRARLMLGP